MLRTTKLWDAVTGALIRTFEGHSDQVRSVAFSPDGSRVLSGSADNTIKLWDAATGALIRTFEGHSDQVRSVAFSPDGARVLSGSSDKTIKLWDAATGELIRETAVIKGASADPAIALTLKPGELVKIIRTEGAWALIEHDGREIGFVPSNALIVIRHN